MIKIEYIPNSVQYLEMSDERYFSKEFSNCISNSKLSLINPDQGGSVEKYLAGFTPNYSNSLFLGSAVHELILQPKDFKLSDNIIRPSAKVGFIADILYKKYKKTKELPTLEEVKEACIKVDYYSKSLTDSRINNVLEQCIPYLESRYKEEKSPEYLNAESIFLDTRNYDTCMQCISSLNMNPNIMQLLHPKESMIMNEAALFLDFKATDTETGKSVILKVKGKLDNFTVDTDKCSLVLNDLKTSGHPLEYFKHSFKEYHYARQMGLYAFMLKEYVAKYHNLTNINSFKANMLVVSTVSECNSGIYEVYDSEIKEGFQEFIRLLKMAAEVELNKIQDGDLDA